MRLIVAIFVVPAPFEVIIGLVTRESYDFARLAIIGGALGLFALIAGLGRSQRIHAQSIVGFYLALAGAAITAFGVAVTFWGQDVVGATRWSPTVEMTVSALAPSCGLLLIASGLYLIRERRQRVREELDTPPPPTIGSPRPLRINENNAALWQSDHFATRPGAGSIVAVCKAHLSTDDLHYVAYYTNDDRCLFYLDYLDDDELAHFDVVDRAERRRLYEQHGRHLKSLTMKLDERLRTIDSGLIVRLVLDVEKGSLFLYNLKRDGFLLGVTLDQSKVDPTDRKLSTLANEILQVRGGRPDDDFYRN